MSWLTAALRSSVGKKFLMGCTGLFLCLFLVIHLGGNLLLYAGPERYNDYAHALHENQAFLVAAEIVLYAAFLVHIYLAIVLTLEYREARQERYAVRQSKREGESLPQPIRPSATMAITGAVVFAFLILHLWDFKFDRFGGVPDELEPFDKAMLIMRGTVHDGFYLLASLLLGWHVAHGLASAFQSLGVNHPGYNRCLKWTSVIFAFIVAIGFGSFSFWEGSRSQPPPADSADNAAQVEPAEVEPAAGTPD